MHVKHNLAILLFVNTGHIMGILFVLINSQIMLQIRRREKRTAFHSLFILPCESYVTLIKGTNSYSKQRITAEADSLQGRLYALLRTDAASPVNANVCFLTL